MSSTSYTRTVAWSELGDLDGIIHPRDIIEMRNDRERAKRATTFQVSNGYFPMSKGWAIYNGATIPVYDEHGREHLITPKRHQVLLWALGRIARDDCSTTLREGAAELHMSPQTVSNALQRFMAWGMLAYGSVRGKYGGLILFARSKGDNLGRFAREAWQRLRASYQRRMARFRARSNVHTYPDRGMDGVQVDPYQHHISTDWTLKRRERDDEIEAILTGQRRGAEKRVPCPAHEGQDRNLAFWRRPDGSLGVKCWSHQCAERDIKNAVVPW